MKKKNFNIVRYFIDGKVVKGTFITKSDAGYMMEKGIMPSSIAHNGGGGKSIWFDLDITPRPFKITEYDYEDELDEDELDEE